MNIELLNEIYFYYKLIEYDFIRYKFPLNKKRKLKIYYICG